MLSIFKKKKCIIGFWKLAGIIHSAILWMEFMQLEFFLSILSRNEKLILQSLEKNLNYKLYKLNIKNPKKLLQIKKLIKKRNNLKMLLRKSMWEKYTDCMFLQTRKNKNYF